MQSIQELNADHSLCAVAYTVSMDWEISEAAEYYVNVWKE